MLDQLVESKYHGRETRQRAKFVGTTFVLVVSLAFSGVLWSLFAKDLAMNGDQIELSTLLAPVALPETQPPPVEPTRRKQPPSAVKNAANETVRQANILRLEETPKVPTEISVVPNSLKARPNTPFRISPNGIESDTQSAKGIERTMDDSSGESGGIGKNVNAPTDNAEVIKTPPPPLKDKKPVEAAPKKTVTVSGGVMNGKALSLPKPAYPAPARTVNAGGDVNVQILIDESGRVVSASAVSGHPLLRGEAEKAARNAKFSPTFLSNNAVKVSGLIVYRFTK